MNFILFEIGVKIQIKRFTIIVDDNLSRTIFWAIGNEVASIQIKAMVIKIAAGHSKMDTKQKAVVAHALT